MEDSGVSEPEAVSEPEGVSKPEGVSEPEGVGGPEGEEAKGELAGKVGDKPFSRLALGLGVGFAGILLAWTILRTISEGFGWPYYGWPYSG